MPAHDLALLIEAAHLAGKIALTHWKKEPEVWEKPGGQGPVSEADLAVNAALEAMLRAARPDYGWLSEESADGPDRLHAKAQFILDPIDGTRSFLQGHDSFSHSLAVVREGAVVAGVVYLPAQDRLYAAASGGPATLNGREISVAPCLEADGAQVLTGKAAMAPDLWPGGVPALDRHFRASMAWRLCLVAEGAFDAMLTLRPSWEWDIAAGTLIATQAGAKVTDRSGLPLRFNGKDPRCDGVVVAGPGLHDDLIQRLTARQR